MRLTLIINLLMKSNMEASNQDVKNKKTVAFEEPKETPSLQTISGKEENPTAKIVEQPVDHPRE